MTNIDSENWLGATYEGNAEHSAGMLDVNRFFGILRSNLNILFFLLNKIQYEPTTSKTVNPRRGGGGICVIRRQFWKALALLIPNPETATPQCFLSSIKIDDFKTLIVYSVSARVKS